ncbi:universal stress protein UspE [Algicola sagamiensis]|uniref:universal stress protein UspE n=1 Tax=Algicola sagamiensis TaxID=163869 RepID=UPI0003632BAB|nr:universal stress protein UspE [Algicola sagamiensis]
MRTFSKILVVLDPTTDEQKALSRAVELSKKCGAKLTAFIAIYDFSYEMTTMLSVAEREAMRNAVITDRETWISDFIAPYLEEGIEIESLVVWHNRPFEAIINAVKSSDFDLVIKGTHKHDALKSVIFTPTDWHLLRKCPSPVLLVKDHAWPADGSILAAVNSGSEESHHISLNTEIVNEAKYMAELIAANVHIVNAYPGTPVNIAIEIPEFDPNQYNAAVRTHHEDSTSEIAEQFSLAQNHIHVAEGLPEDVIPKVAEDIDAELVIMGTIGRTGLSAALIGNTAEHVIDRLNCDVLALKPVGFKCPI